MAVYQCIPKNDDFQMPLCLLQNNFVILRHIIIGYNYEEKNIVFSGNTKSGND